MTHPVEHFEALINKGENCAKRYFADQFLGACEFTFDIAPIVTLPNPLKYYGKTRTEVMKGLMRLWLRLVVWPTKRH